MKKIFCSIFFTLLMFLAVSAMEAQTLKNNSLSVPDSGRYWNDVSQPRITNSQDINPPTSKEYIGVPDPGNWTSPVPHMKIIKETDPKEIPGTTGSTENYIKHPKKSVTVEQKRISDLHKSMSVTPVDPEDMIDKSNSASLIDKSNSENLIEKQNPDELIDRNGSKDFGSSLTMDDLIKKPSFDEIMGRGDSNNNNQNKPTYTIIQQGASGGFNNSKGSPYYVDGSGSNFFRNRQNNYGGHRPGL